MSTCASHVFLNQTTKILFKVSLYVVAAGKDKVVIFYCLHFVKKKKTGKLGFLAAAA